VRQAYVEMAVAEKRFAAEAQGLGRHTDLADHGHVWVACILPVTEMSTVDGVDLAAQLVDHRRRLRRFRNTLLCSVNRSRDRCARLHRPG
jgi:hypothetical protein